MEAAPPLILVGAGDALAILIDRTDQKVVRLRQGESRAGTVQPCEMTLKQGGRSEVLVLRRLDGQLAPPPTPPGVPGVASAPVEGGKLVAPTAGDLSFEPFVSRSGPKNGESDGL
ncbi:hypothetical protein AB7645_13075 [Bradyrhizobium sp. 956_D2_N1_5]|uniref:hypothetical protein n=1 Tax=unclassified Bradyrhizobium TaxID=2631580 RepID=UPI003F200B1D